MMNKYFSLSIFFLLSSCLSPGEIDRTTDQQAESIDRLLNLSSIQLSDYKIVKQVILDGKQRLATEFSDTLVVQKDLKTLTEYSFTRLISHTNYDKFDTSNGYKYLRKEGEKNGPGSVLLQQDENRQIARVEVNFANKNLLYESNEKFVLNFKNEKLTRYKILGTRKLIGMNPSSYEIEVEIKQL